MRTPGCTDSPTTLARNRASCARRRSPTISIRGLASPSVAATLAASCLLPIIPRSKSSRHYSDKAVVTVGILVTPTVSHHPIAHCACGRLAGVKPKPPAAVASRGLTPASRPKADSGSDSGTDEVLRLPSCERHQPRMDRAERSLTRTQRNAGQTASPAAAARKPAPAAGPPHRAGRDRASDRVGVAPHTSPDTWNRAGWRHAPSDTPCCATGRAPRSA